LVGLVIGRQSVSHGESPIDMFIKQGGPHQFSQGVVVVQVSRTPIGDGPALYMGRAGSVGR